MHHKLIVFGIILVAVVIFGFLFWNNFSDNQQEIANTPLITPEEAAEQDAALPANSGDAANPESSLYEGEGTANLSGSDGLDDIEQDLEGTDVDNLDSGSSDLEAELNAL